MIRTTREANVPRVSAVSSVMNHENARPYVFRNYALPHRHQSLYSGSFRHKEWEAVRATSAAPGYFEEFRLEESIHHDGGLLVNNPCAVAIHEAKCLWPNADLQCVVSIGTGRSHPIDFANRGRNGAGGAGGGSGGGSGGDSNSTSLKKKLSSLIDSATDTERE